MNNRTVTNGIIAALEYLGNDATDDSPEAFAVRRALGAALREMNEPPPVPIVSKWTVEGTVHLAGGFRVTVDAKDRAQAERKAKMLCHNAWENGEDCMDWGLGVQEVCPSGAWRDEEDASDKPWIIVNPDSPGLAWSGLTGMWVPHDFTRYTQEEKADGLIQLPVNGVWAKSRIG